MEGKIKLFAHIYMLSIAGQTAVPITWNYAYSPFKAHQVNVLPSPEGGGGGGGQGGGGGGGGGGSLEDAIPGVPGADYPVYAQVPDTGFSCDGRVKELLQLISNEKRSLYIIEVIHQIYFKASQWLWIYLNKSLKYFL